MSDDRNPIRDAFERSLPHDQFARLMEGIGRLSLAIAFAEFRLDCIGWRLTGDLEAYRILMGSTSLSPKCDKVRDMCREMILDTQLQERVVRFCGGLKSLAGERNDWVHSLYSKEDHGILRFTFPRKGDLKIVTLEDLSAIEGRVGQHIDNYPHIDEEVYRAIQAYREGARNLAMGTSTPKES